MTSKSNNMQREATIFLLLLFLTTFISISGSVEVQHIYNNWWANDDQDKNEPEKVCLMASFDLTVTVIPMMSPDLYPTVTFDHIKTEDAGWVRANCTGDRTTTWGFKINNQQVHEKKPKWPRLSVTVRLFGNAIFIQLSFESLKHPLDPKGIFRNSEKFHRLKAEFPSGYIAPNRTYSCEYNRPFTIIDYGYEGQRGIQYADFKVKIHDIKVAAISRVPKDGNFPSDRKLCWADWALQYHVLAIAVAFVLVTTMVCCICCCCDCCCGTSKKKGKKKKKQAWTTNGGYRNGVSKDKKKLTKRNRDVEEDVFDEDQFECEIAKF